MNSGPALLTAGVPVSGRHFGRTGLAHLLTLDSGPAKAPARRPPRLAGHRSRSSRPLNDRVADQKLSRRRCRAVAISSSVSLPVLGSVEAVPPFSATGSGQGGAEVPPGRNCLQSAQTRLPVIFRAVGRQPASSSRNDVSSSQLNLERLREIEVQFVDQGDVGSSSFCVQSSHRCRKRYNLAGSERIITEAEGTSWAVWQRSWSA